MDEGDGKGRAQAWQEAAQAATPQWDTLHTRGTRWRLHACKGCMLVQTLDTAAARCLSVQCVATSLDFCWQA